MIERADAAKVARRRSPLFHVDFVSINADRSFSVWRLSVDRAQAVTLGSAGSEISCYSMYGIAAIARAGADAGPAANVLARARDSHLTRSVVSPRGQFDRAHGCLLAF